MGARGGVKFREEAMQEGAVNYLTITTVGGFALTGEEAGRKMYHARGMRQIAR